MNLANSSVGARRKALDVYQPKRTSVLCRACRTGVMRGNALFDIRGDTGVETAIFH